MLETYYAHKFQFLKIDIFKVLEHIWKRRAPNNDEDPRNKNLQNLGYEINIYQKA